MRTSKRLLSWFVVCFMMVSIVCLSLTGYSVKAVEFKTIEPGVLTVGTNTGFPPFEYVGDDGKPDGFDVAFIKAIGEKLGLQVKVEDMEFNSLVASVGNKTDVAIAGMTVTDERNSFGPLGVGGPYDYGGTFIIKGDGVNVRLNDECLKGTQHTYIMQGSRTISFSSNKTNIYKSNSAEPSNKATFSGNSLWIRSLFDGTDWYLCD